MDTNTEIIQAYEKQLCKIERVLAELTGVTAGIRSDFKENPNVINWGHVNELTRAYNQLCEVEQGL